MPVARRAYGESNEITLRMRWTYAEVLYKADSATLDDIREAVSTLEELAPTARRVLGGTHPVAVDIEVELQDACATLGARNFFPRGACVS